MKYNTREIPDKAKAQQYLAELIEKGATIELKRIYPKRTNRQNRYIHLLFGLFSIEYGYTVEEAKDAVKEELGYVYEKHGRTFRAKTSKMDTKELTYFIDKFRRWSGDNGCYLPTPDEADEKWIYYQNEIERHEQYL